MTQDFIQALPDRWIVHARQSALTEIDAIRGTTLRLEFDTGLLLEITGQWRATAGSPRTGPDVDLGSGLDRLGATILSLVLFESGAVRLVLSDGTTITARAAEGTRIRSSHQREYEWAADEAGVQHFRSGVEE